MPITSLDVFLEEFHGAYLRRKADRQYPTQLPLEWRGYQISEVHTPRAKQTLYDVLSQPVFPVEPHGPRNRNMPALHGLVVSVELFFVLPEPATIIADRADAKSHRFVPPPGWYIP